MIREVAAGNRRLLIMGSATSASIRPCTGSDGLYIVGSSGSPYPQQMESNTSLQFPEMDFSGSGISIHRSTMYLWLAYLTTAGAFGLYRRHLGERYPCQVPVYGWLA